MAQVGSAAEGLATHGQGLLLVSLLHRDPGGTMIRWLLALAVGPEMVYSHRAIASIEASMAEHGAA